MKKIIVCICYRDDSYIFEPKIFDGDMDINTAIDKVMEEMIKERIDLFDYYNPDNLREDYVFSAFVVEI